MDYREAKEQAIVELEKKTGRDYRDLIPWKDFDPIILDNRALEIMRPHVRFMGD